MEEKQVLEMLKSSDTEKQREGAWEAGEMVLYDAIPDLVCFLASENLGVQEAANLALRKIGGREAVGALIPLLRTEQTAVRNLAMDILREIGTQGVRSLVPLLKDDDVDIRIFVSDILGSTDSAVAVTALCESLLNDAEVNVRYQSAVSLGELGRADAVSVLSQVLGKDEEWVQFAAIEALLKIGDSSVVDKMIEASDNGSEFISAIVVDALGQMGGLRAIPRLFRRLNNASPALRNKILKSLVILAGDMFFSFVPEKDREQVYEYLLVALQDDDESVQDAAIKGLSFFGRSEGLETMLHIVAQISEDEFPERREALIVCLARNGFFVDVYEKALQEENEEQAIVVVEIFGLMNDEACVDLLLKYFDKFLHGVQRVATKVLSRIASSQHATFFMQLLERDNLDGDMIKDALYFLGDRMTFADADIVVMSYLNHMYDDVKEAALGACIAINTENIMKKMTEMAVSDDPVQRLMGVYALGRLAPLQFQDIFRKNLQDNFADVRRIALESLAKSISDEDELLALTEEALQDEEKNVRLAAVAILQKISTEKANAYLMRALQDEDDWVKIRVIEVLGEKNVASCVEKLIPLLDDSSPFVTMKVIHAFEKIQGESVVLALIRYLSSTESEELQAAAASALKNIEQGSTGGLQW